MLNSRVTAVFADKNSAERVVEELRRQGVRDSHLSVITGHEQAAGVAAGAGEGLLAGAGVGALFGLAAALIPGVGPFISAGFLASTLGALGGGAAAGAIVGGSAGLIAGALARAGYSKPEAEYFGTELEAGRVLLAVETGAAISDAAVAAVIKQYGGRLFQGLPA
jgi:hypothetical protein